MNFTITKAFKPDNRDQAFELIRTGEGSLYLGTALACLAGWHNVLAATTLTFADELLSALFAMAAVGLIGTFTWCVVFSHKRARYHGIAPIWLGEIVVVSLTALYVYIGATVFDTSWLLLFLCALFLAIAGSVLAGTANAYEQYKV